MLAKIARRRSSWKEGRGPARIETASDLKKAYLEHVFWQWFDQLPFPEQDRYYSIGTLLTGVYVVLVATPEKPDDHLEGKGYPFQDEAGLRYLELICGQKPGYPYLSKEELDHCLRATGSLIEDFLREAVARSRKEEQDPELVRALAYLHFATFGALVRNKTIKKSFLESSLSVLKDRRDEDPTRVNLVLATDLVTEMMNTAGKETPEAVQTRISNLHAVLSRFPGLLDLLVRQELLQARKLTTAIHEFRSKTRELLKDVTFVPDNPKVELFLRRTALMGFTQEFNHRREPFTRYHAKVVRPEYRAMKTVASSVDDPRLGERTLSFLSRLTRLMEFLRLVRAPQERKDLADQFSAVPFQNLALALSLQEARDTIQAFSLPDEDDDLGLDFDSGFAIHKADPSVPPPDLFDPAALNEGLDADEVAAALESHSVEKTGLDANRLFDLFAIFTWRLGKSVHQLERKINTPHPAEVSGRHHFVLTEPQNEAEAESRVRDQVIQDFREAVLSQCRQVLWELCHELDDTLTFEAIIPEFRQGKVRALRLRSQLEALLDRATRYHGLLRREEGLSAMEEPDLARRNQLLKQSFLLEVKHFQRAKIAFRPDDREIFYAKLRQIAVSEEPKEIHRQMDDLMHFLEGLLDAVNRRWVLTLHDREQLEECKTEIESLLLGSREPDQKAMEDLLARLEILKSRSPIFNAAGEVIREEILPLLARELSEERTDSAALPNLIKTRLEKVHASIAQVLESSL